MNAAQIHFGLGAAGLLFVSGLAGTWVSSAADRLEKLEAVKAAGGVPEVAVASASDESYCSGALRPILRRVLTSCGLLKSSGSRGCQPLEAKTVAAMSGGDFNTLFSPLSDRAAILQFAKDADELDAPARELLDQTFADQRGASYFLVVSRASPEGSAAHNRQLSQRRAEAVIAHLTETYNDPDIDKEVGLLWLGEEFAQLDDQFCQWTRSRPDGRCTSKDLNRSAFITWIDCQL